MHERRKYQVFISSTFSDLRSAREQVTWSILKAGHIPVGMESFPATDDRGWKIIHRTIAESDYYVLIIGMMYGSVDPGTGLSYTEMEYDFAVSTGVPVLAFLQEHTAYVRGDHIERDPDKLPKLLRFRSKIEDHHHRQSWATVDDLVANVPLTLLRHIADDEINGGRPGWFRGPPGIPVDVHAAVMAELAELKAVDTFLDDQATSISETVVDAAIELVLSTMDTCFVMYADPVRVEEVVRTRTQRALGAENRGSWKRDQMNEPTLRSLFQLVISTLEMELQNASNEFPAWDSYTMKSDSLDDNDE